MKHPLDSPWRRLLAVVLVLCATLAAVPALAHCCADRCHDAEPPAAQADDCDCTLAGVEPPVDVIPVAPDPAGVATVAGLLPVAPDVPLPTSHVAPPIDAAPRGAPDRTVVLRI